MMRAQRPTFETSVTNLFLASDNVRTTMDLATMEAANEDNLDAAAGQVTTSG